MTDHSAVVFNYDHVLTSAVPYEPGRALSMSALKAHQSAKIQEIADALFAAGFVVLDEQARALGLARSTTWTVLKHNHKNTGLSASTIYHILSSPQLPPSVRKTVIEYVEEKLVGLYGHSHLQRRRFLAHLTAMLAESGHLEDIAA